MKLPFFEQSNAWAGNIPWLNQTPPRDYLRSISSRARKRKQHEQKSYPCDLQAPHTRKRNLLAMQRELTRQRPLHRAGLTAYSADQGLSSENAREAIADLGIGKAQA